MIVSAWPAGRPFLPADFDMWMEGTDTSTRSLLSPAVQTSGVPAAFWRVAMTFSPELAGDRQQLLAYLRGLNGMENRTRLFDMRKFGLGGLQGYPAGTINTAGVKVKTLAAQFATSLVLKNCGNTKTLSYCDMWSVNGQLVENSALATSDAGGDMTVAIPERLRVPAAADTDVVLVKPFATFIMRTPFHAVRAAAMYRDFVVEFDEAPE